MQQSQMKLGQELQQFYKLCDDAKAKELGERINEENAYIFVGLLITLGAVYGHDKQKMLGDRYADDPAARFNHVMPIVHFWKYNRLNPYTMIGQLRKVPATFDRFPTFGMIKDLDRSLNLRTCPKGWVKPDIAEQQHA